jgi:hypothetical protein
MRILALAAVLLAVAPVAVAADAQPPRRPGYHHNHHPRWHKRKVCRTVWHNHRRVRRCFYR